MAKDITFVFDEKKSTLLRHLRGIGFEEIIEYIENDWTLAIIKHPNQTLHPNQLVYEVAVEGYVIEVPFFADGKKHHLKTLYLSRKATKKHIVKGNL